LRNDVTRCFLLVSLPGDWTRKNNQKILALRRCETNHALP
jgi:hypothetical protein